MATNEYFKVGHNVSLPVPDGTVSSQPFRLGVLNGVTQTDAGDGGNAGTHASTKLDGAHWLDVTGAVEPGDVIYISGEGANATLHAASAAGRLVFGAALTSKGTGTGKVAVLVDTINTDAAAV